MRAGLCFRYGAARRRTGAARAHAVREGHHGGQPRPCDVVASAVPRRRLAALCAGFAEPAGLARLLARTYIHARRHPGRLGGAGRSGARAARNLIKNMKRSLAAAVFLIALSTAVHAASGKQPPPAGALAGAPAEYTNFSPAELTRGFLALAFGSDLRIGAKPRGIRRFDHPIRVAVIA